MVDERNRLGSQEVREIHGQGGLAVIGGVWFTGAALGSLTGLLQTLINVLMLSMFLCSHNH